MESAKPSLGRQVRYVLPEDSTRAGEIRTAIVVGISYVPAGSDIYPLLASPNGAPLYLVPKASYHVSKTVTIPAALSIFGNANPLNIAPLPGATSGIIVRGDGCEFEGLLPSMPNGGPVGGVSFRLYGVDPSQRKGAVVGTRFRNCIWNSGAVDCAINVDAWADDVSVEDCNFGILNSQGVYSTADNTSIIDCNFAGSNGEHPIRFDLNGSTSHRPVNALIARCNVTNQNGAGKEAIAIRECDDILIDGGSITGWLDVGQGNSDMAWHVRRAVVRDLLFTKLRLPNSPIVQVRHDVDIIFDGCTFPGSAAASAILADERTVIVTRGNQYAAPVLATFKPLVSIAATGKLLAA